jgi:hypothetical protein
MLNVWIEDNENYVWSSPISVSFFTTTSEGLWKLPYDYDSYDLFIGIESIFGINTEQLCEPKYTPITCTFY